MVAHPGRHDRHRPVTAAAKRERALRARPCASPAQPAPRQPRALRRVTVVLPERGAAGIDSLPGRAGTGTAGSLDELPEFDQLGRKQIAARDGLAPFNCGSGLLRGRRIVWDGRAGVRSSL